MPSADSGWDAGVPPTWRVGEPTFIPAAWPCEEQLYERDAALGAWPVVWLDADENERRGMYAPRHRWVSDR